MIARCYSRPPGIRRPSMASPPEKTKTGSGAGKTSRICLLLSACLSLMASGCAMQEKSPSPESTVCGWIQEPFIFAMWNHMAGEPNPTRAAGVPNAEAISHRTADGRILRGYKLRSTAAGGATAGRLLVVQGNAMLSDRLLSSLTGFSDAGLEVYIFDYRGYGNSEGRRRLKAMVADYREMASELLGPSDGKRLLYGISFGGVIVLNVVGAGAAYDRAVIDSTPSRLSNRGCLPQYDPVANLPSDASKLLLVAGEGDTVVPITDSEELVTRAGILGARTEVRADYAHPFMDEDAEVRRSRFDLIRSFLLE